MDSLQVTFFPTESQINEIEKWLIEEKRVTGHSFYCNWNLIKSSFDNNQIAIISYRERPVGFATWWMSTEKTARIEIAEIEPSYRKKGIGKRLTTVLLDFLLDKGIYVVDLQCAPESSEPIWKRLGFIEFAPTEGYRFDNHSNKRLYKILTKYLQPSSSTNSIETIELWNNEPYMASKNTTPTHIWNLEFIPGTRILSEPIVIPGHYKWRLQWKRNGEIFKDGQVRYFGTKIDFRDFIIIDQLPLA